MLKARIIPTLLFDSNFQCVKPISFERPYRKLGTLTQYINVLEKRNIDELILIDIEATKDQRKINYGELRSFLGDLFCPTCIGGAIFTLDDISALLNNGADKVCINTRFLEDPGFIEKAARKFGSQAIVVAINSYSTPMGNFITNAYYTELCDLTPKAMCHEAQNLGAGEILLTDVQKDGTMKGYNCDLIFECSYDLSIPVIANGGCGEASHMAHALRSGASAVAAGSMFLYTEATPKRCAKYLHEEKFNVRLHG